MNRIIRLIGTSLSTLLIGVLASLISRNVSVDIWTWIERLVPVLPSLLHMVVTAIIGLLFIMALIWALISAMFICVRACWRYFRDREVRLTLVDDYHRWPNRKRDVVSVVSLVSSVASMVTLLVFARVYTSSDSFVPSDPGDAAYATVSAMLIPMVCFLPYFAIAMWEVFCNFVQQFRSENTKGRVILGSVLVFTIFAYLFLMVGEHMGWDQYPPVQ